MFKLFSGTSNPKLATSVSSLLHLPLSASEVVRFENSEIRVRVHEDVKNHTCVLIQSTSNPTDTHLMELFFSVMPCAARRQKSHRYYPLFWIRTPRCSTSAGRVCLGECDN